MVVSHQDVMIGGHAMTAVMTELHAMTAVMAELHAVTAAMTEGHAATAAMTEGHAATAAMTEGHAVTAAMTELHAATAAMTEGHAATAAMTEGHAVTAAMTEGHAVTAAMTELHAVTAEMTGGHVATAAMIGGHVHQEATGMIRGHNVMIARRVNDIVMETNASPLPMNRRLYVGVEGNRPAREVDVGVQAHADVEQGLVREAEAEVMAAVDVAERALHPRVQRASVIQTKQGQRPTHQTSMFSKKISMKTSLKNAR